MSEASAKLHIHGGDDALHEISAERLCQFVTGLQRMTYLTAAGLYGQGNRKRIFGTSDFENEYQVVCLIPKAGSYLLPFKIRNNARPIADESDKVLAALLAALMGLSSGDISNTVLRDLSPENRSRFAQEVSRMVPKDGNQWRISIDLDENGDVNDVPSSFEFTPDLTEKAEHVLKVVETPPEEIMSVIGDLIKVDFESCTLTLRHKQTHREIRCAYRPEVVDQILQNRVGGVQVTGRFTLDDEGNPKNLSDVSSVVAVDLSRLVFAQFKVAGRVVKAKKDADVSFIPQLDEDTKQFFVARRSDLGIDAFAQTREGLLAEIQEQLAVSWSEYAKAEDVELTPSAIDVKNALLAAYAEEVA